mgnify:CR=1 FL=1
MTFLRVPDASIRNLSMTLVISAVLGTLGCTSSATSQDNPPAWIENPSESYSERRYLMATGSGNSPQQAEEAALGNLARIFEATIESDRQTVQDYAEISRDGQIAATEETARMLDLTNVRSEQDLLNTEILAQSERGRLYYALAGMERTPTLSIYTDRIQTNREQIRAYADAGDTREDPIARLSAYRQALILTEINSDLIEQRSIIAGGGGAFSMDDGFTLSVQDLEERFAEAQRDAPLYIEGNAPDDILTEASSTVEALGFVTIRNPNEAILRVYVDYKHEPVLESREDASFLYWTLNVSLSHSHREQTYGTFSVDDRSGATSERGVRIRAHRNAREALTEEFSSFVVRSLLQVSVE